MREDVSGSVLIVSREPRAYCARRERWSIQGLWAGSGVSELGLDGGEEGREIGVRLRRAGRGDKDRGVEGFWKGILEEDGEWARRGKAAE